MNKLFGTDGARGLANVELTPELAFNLGRAGAYVLTKHTDKPPKIIVGMDTRLSGYMLESALTSGMASVGASSLSAGVIPTPAIAYLTRKYGMDAGVMISASHNPFYDNGIKFFDSNGLKLKDEMEAEIEGYILNGMAGIPRPSRGEIGVKMATGSPLWDYIWHLKSAAGGESLKGLRVALDCANGATFIAAPNVFREMGASVLESHGSPNGININDGCGSTNISALARHVKDSGADIGFAFDGDGDRLITVDENGGVVDGDQYLSIMGNDMKKKGSLVKNTLVTSVMANLGFLKMCEARGLNAEITKVGDRHVLERMIKHGYNLGGEQSGHIIFLDCGAAGDGILSALKLAVAVRDSGKRLSQLNNYMTVYPQALVNANIPNQKKHEYIENETIAAAVAECEKAMEGRGRVLIRPSGTEPLVRVMIEGEDETEIHSRADYIARLIESCLAAG
jgi:phosphoglucosamine mutase